MSNEVYEPILNQILLAVQGINEQLISINSRLSCIEMRLDAVESRLDAVESRLDAVESRLDSVESRLDAMEIHFAEADARLDSLEYSVRDLRLTLENVTNNNIKTIAEGHLDLSRKLDIALETAADNEIFKIRLTTLENEYRRLHDKINVIA